MQIERKGDNLVITVPCGASTIATGKVSGSGKSFVFGADKLKSGEFTVQVTAYGPLSLGTPKPAETKAAA